MHQDALFRCGVTALATQGPWASSCRSFRGGRCQELGRGSQRPQGRLVMTGEAVGPRTHQGGPGSNHSLCSLGHVFPEFKESDAMFAAERVSPGCRGCRLGAALGRLEGAWMGPVRSTGGRRAAVCLKNENVWHCQVSLQAEIRTQVKVLPLDWGWWVHVVKQILTCPWSRGMSCC